MIIDEVTETLRESLWPNIGITIFSFDFLSHFWERPLSSDPNAIAKLFKKETFVNNFVFFDNEVQYNLILFFSKNLKISSSLDSVIFKLKIAPSLDLIIFGL